MSNKLDIINQQILDEQRLTTEQVALYLNMSESYIQKNRKAPPGNRIPFIKIGRFYRYKKDAVDAFFNLKSSDTVDGGSDE